MYCANASFFPIIFASLFGLVVFYIWAMRRRRSLVERFVEKNLVEGISPSVSMKRKMVKILMLSLVVILGLFALARPQWGFEWEEIKRSGLDILIAIDVSKSMLATDVKPNRLTRSKFAVKDLLKKLNGDRVGLIAFAGTSFLQCPLTIDYNGFMLALDDLNADTIPRGGTSISSAIKEAIGAFSAGGGKSAPDKKYKVLVVISDGEDFEGDAMRMAKEAQDIGIKIYCVGVGAIKGELIPFYSEDGRRGYLADKSGNVVKTKLNEDVLKRLAISTGGSYVHATQSEFGLALLYDKSISKLEKRDIESNMRKHYQERFQPLIAFAVFLLFIEPFISERKRLPS